MNRLTGLTYSERFFITSSVLVFSHAFLPAQVTHCMYPLIWECVRWTSSCVTAATITACVAPTTHIVNGTRTPTCASHTNLGTILFYIFLSILLTLGVFFFWRECTWLKITACLFMDSLDSLYSFSSNFLIPNIISLYNMEEVFVAIWPQPYIFTSECSKMF